MTKQKTSDLHAHLGGSVSRSFLKEIAQKNGRINEYNDYVRLNDEYLLLTENQPEDGFPEDLVKLAWEQFSPIHKILETPEDITAAVIDTVKTSTAKYLEIRTTPKGTDENTKRKYIKAFEQGLVHANEQCKDKQAVGLLSVDRSRHRVEDAEFFIKYILESTEGVLAGLDISGNFLLPRALTPEMLAKVIDLTLSKGLAIGVHMGESNTDIERADTDAALAAIQRWKLAQPESNRNPLHGKVRLGHCIYLTDAQKDLIRELDVPIEICPTCHTKLNWCVKKHPVSDIYPDVGNAIVPGTDDRAIFGSDAKQELTKFMQFFTNVNNLSRKELKTRHSEYRFSRSL